MILKFVILYKKSLSKVTTKKIITAKLENLYEIDIFINTLGTWTIKIY